MLKWLNIGAQLRYVILIYYSGFLDDISSNDLNAKLYKQFVMAKGPYFKKTANDSTCVLTMLFMSKCGNLSLQCRGIWFARSLGSWHCAPYKVPLYIRGGLKKL